MAVGGCTVKLYMNMEEVVAMLSRDAQIACAALRNNQNANLKEIL